MFRTLVLSYLMVFSLLAGHGAWAQTTDTNEPLSELYYQIGGETTVEKLVDAFINEIGYNKVIFHYFENSNVERFREKMIEHLCITLDGPCTYSGDSMAQVHTGMNITESDFNLTVELLINAMTTAEIKHRHQNKILARLAPMRKDIIYR